MAEKPDDWRLTGQEAYLFGVHLEWSNWTIPADNPAWDHDHCEFCWSKFMSVESSEAEHAGYTTADRRHWICLRCFHDFKNRFEWKVRADSQPIPPQTQ